MSREARPACPAAQGTAIPGSLLPHTGLASEAGSHTHARSQTHRRTHAQAHKCAEGLGRYHQRGQMWGQRVLGGPGRRALLKKGHHWHN